MFLALGATALAGCAAGGAAADPAPDRAERVVNAGPVEQYSVDGVYSKFRESGFFIVRRGPALFALSAICTHRRCTLTVAADRTFRCPCHGSTFDPGGAVTRGPARRHLPILKTATNDRNELLVTILST